MAGVGKPGLIVHAFAPVGGGEEDAAVVQSHLAALWKACVDLGMTDELLDGVPLDLPVRPPERELPGFELLAGRSHVSEARVAQAYAFIRHDVIGVSVALASTQDDDALTTWGTLLAEWRAATGDDRPPPQLLGGDYCFIAHADGDPAQLPERYGSDVWKALQAAGLDCWDVPFRTADGFSIWEWQDPAARRVLAFLSTRAGEDDLSRWLWWQGDRELAPFGRYLLNAAKLAYEARVYEGARRSMGHQIREIDRGLETLMALHHPGRLAGRSSFQVLQEAQGRLADAQGQVAGLAIDLTRLRALKRTVNIARHNLALSAPEAAPGQQAAAGQVFERDQSLAAWLDSQIDEDVGYAEAAVERAREAQNVTQLRLQQALTQLTRAQNRVALLQTSLISALLASFTVVSVLKIQPPVPTGQYGSVLASVVALLLAMPALAAHWYERYGLIDHLAAILFGSALGWEVAAILTGSSTTGEPPAALALVGAIAGGAIARLVTALHDRWLLAELKRDGRTQV